MTFRVLVVDDHMLLAQLLADALCAHGLDATRAPSTDHAAVLARADAETLVLLDLHLAAGEDGSALVAPLRAAGARVLVLTGSEDLLAIGRALEAGAIDALDKSAGFDNLVDAIVACGAGLQPHESASRYRMLQHVQAREARRAAAETVLSRLTRRELAVLDALVSGGSADDIATGSVVSLTTVRTQIRAILSKLGVHNQVAAVARARELYDDVGRPTRQQA